MLTFMSNAFRVAERTASAARSRGANAASRRLKSDSPLVPLNPIRPGRYLGAAGLQQFSGLVPPRLCHEISLQVGGEIFHVDTRIYAPSNCVLPEVLVSE